MTSPVQSKYQEIETRLHQLSLRERAIILGAVIVLLLGLFDQLLLRPWMQERETLERDKASLLSNMEQASQRIDELEAAIRANPNLVLKASIEQLQQQHHQVDQQIARFTEGLITPQEMPHLLAELLSERYGLRVESVKSKPARRLLVADEQQAQSAAIYQHDLELKLAGSFFQVRDYLAAVEALPTRLLWDHLEYVVDEYPKGSLWLQVHTLSSEEELLRVPHSL